MPCVNASEAQAVLGTATGDEPPKGAQSAKWLVKAHAVAAHGALRNCRLRQAARAIATPHIGVAP